MGTRSITIMREHDKEIAVLYRQFDGYPSGRGADIAKALGGKQVVSGYTDDSQINGAGDMAVQLVAWLKHESTVNASYNPRPINSAGGFYLYPAGTRGCGEEYTYTLTCTSPAEGRAGYEKRDSFDGSMSDYVKWLEAAPWSDEDESEDDE